MAESVYSSLLNDRICEKVHDAFSPEEQKNSIMNKIFFGTICHDLVKFLIEMMYDKLQIISAFAMNRYPEGRTRSRSVTPELIQGLVETEINYYDDLSQEVSVKTQQYNKLWGLTMKDQKKYVNQYRRTFKEVTDHVEDFKQKMITIIH